MQKKTIKKCFNKILSLFLFFTIMLNLFAVNVFSLDLTIKGDVNFDGKVSVKDALSVLRHIASLDTLTVFAQDNADFDGDGIITFSDARNILKISVDLPPEQKELQSFEQISPEKTNSGLGKADFIMVKEYCGETFPQSPVNDKSSPLYSPLPKGTVDIVKGKKVKDSESEKEYYVLNSGRRIYAHEVKVFTGYKMPKNNIEIMDKTVTAKSSTTMYLKLDWRVPFNVTIKPQEYETGYNSRPFNIKDDNFTAEYMDIVFYYTSSFAGETSFPDSNMIKGMKWYKNTENNTCTLRIYFKNSGEFKGYSAYYDSKNYLVISVKEDVNDLKDTVIMLDPGHGGNQPGAGSGTGVYERDVTYKIAQELEKLLKNSGATVIYSRDNSSSVPEIEERRIDAMKKNPDMFISIHCDASDSSSTNGSSVYYYKNYSGPLSLAISKELPKAVKSSYGYEMKNKGSHFYPFCVTRIENCPSVLVECGFISNFGDFNVINSSNGRKAIAKGIYNGIVKYYNS